MLFFFNYEIIFSGFTPHPKNKKRPQWILNQSNDAWFGNSFGPLQHSNMAAYRAIEEGVPVVRAAANGVSGIISPLGHYEQYMGPKETGFLDVKLPKPKTKTFFSTHVNYLMYFYKSSTNVHYKINIESPYEKKRYLSSIAFAYIFFRILSPVFSPGFRKAATKQRRVDPGKWKFVSK